MAAIELNSPEEAFALFMAAVEGRLNPDGLDQVEIGDWVDPQVHVKLGHSEITPPFMEAFVEAQNAIYRLAALVKYDVADIRHLTQEDLDYFQIKVKVTEGSSNYLAEFADALEKIGLAAVGKLTPRQIVSLLAGGAILISGSWGFGTYLNHRKEVRLEEIQSEERRDAIRGLEFANREQAQTARAVIDLMKQQGPIHSRAVESSAEANSALLRAAGSVPEVEINENHLTRSEARELRANSRRGSSHEIIEREMRVVDINTSDPAQTIMVVETVEGENQYKLTFVERLVQARDVTKLHESLKERTSIWLRLDVKKTGDKATAVRILGVVDPPADETVTADAD